MQSFDIHPGQEYDYGDSPKRRDDLQRVKVIEKVRAKCAVRLADRSRRPGSSTERWLFPGKLANQPDSLSAMTKQLARIGLPTMLARNAARRRLTGMLDPDVMRRITNIGSQTANHLHTYYSQPALDRMNVSDDGLTSEATRRSLEGSRPNPWCNDDHHIDLRS